MVYTYIQLSPQTPHLHAWLWRKVVQLGFLTYVIFPKERFFFFWPSASKHSGRFDVTREEWSLNPCRSRQPLTSIDNTNDIDILLATLLFLLHYSFIGLSLRMQQLDKLKCAQG